MRVAYHSPLPPERSGIADYSALLLPALRERLTVDLVKRDARHAARRADVSLYHVGNNPDAHAWIVDALGRAPGVVVLHEFVLHHLVAGMTLGRGDSAAYLAAMHRDAGVVGRLLAHGVVDGLVPPPWESAPERFPLAGEVLTYATGLIVHSRYVERAVRGAGFVGPIWRVPHPAWPVPDDLPDPGLPAVRGPLVGVFGFLNHAKRIPQTLAAFAQVRDRHPGALLVLAGEPVAGLDLDAEIARLGLAADRDVVRFPYVDEPLLWALLRAVDVCVSLRSPTMGETSGIALRALSVGLPLVVSDEGWFAELPQDVALKVPIGEAEVPALALALDALLADAELRAGMARAAAELGRRDHAVDVVADGYLAALEEAAGGPLVRDAVLAELATAASDVGLTADAPELSEVGAHLRGIWRWS